MRVKGPKKQHMPLIRTDRLTLDAYGIARWRQSETANARRD